mmetsp:Transcript_58298/g.136306  ORF Transcript_58298/g.136306 Transcript_58298/m.136306 type:complete len:208 (+) Transcript_58298:488-1111(+)
MAVSSACVLGFDSAKITGRALSFVITSTMPLLKHPGSLPTAPTMHDGLTFSTIVFKSVPKEGLPTTATAFCSSFRKEPCDPSSERQMRPRELVTKIFEAGTPATSLSKETAPRFADPAPWKRNVSFRSCSRMLRMLGSRSLNAPKSAAMVTDAVPWMSSLYVKNLVRYSASNGNASFELKSSNCSKQRFPNKSVAACMNSMMILSWP